MAIGRVFKRKWKKPDGTMGESRFYSIAYPWQGETRVESSRLESESQARALLKQRLAEMGRGTFVPNQDRVYISDLLELLKADYRANNQRSLQDALWKLTPVLNYFEGWKVKAITVDKINAYVTFRLEEKAATATINGELRYLRRMLRLGARHGKLSSIPLIELLKGEARRTGFIDPGEFADLLTHFDDSDVADLIEFLYSTGWRVSAGLGLEWRDVDLVHGTVTMRSELSKNKEPITLPFFAGIEEILQRRHGLRRSECPFVFHRNGRPIKDFRAEWAKATEAANRTGLLVHDLCRSAARNLSRAGVHETVASKFMNRKTLAIYKLYRVVDSEDLRLAGAALDGYLKDAEKAGKVEPLAQSHKQFRHSKRKTAPKGKPK
ncbi:MAG TPA: tyrosine-type recombinase/integrase [Candidatus Binatia bacterium]